MEASPLGEIFKALAILHQTKCQALLNLCNEQQMCFETLMQEQAESQRALHISSCVLCHHATCDTHYNASMADAETFFKPAAPGQRRNGLCNSCTCHRGKPNLLPNNCCHGHSWRITASRRQSCSTSAEHPKSTADASSHPLHTVFEILPSTVVDSR